MAEMDAYASAKLKLSKKSTFEAGVKELQSLLTVNSSELSCQSAPAELSDALTRCFTLLRTRYSAPAFWKAGQELFLSSQLLIADEALKDKLKTYIEECNQFLGLNEPELEEAPRGPERRGFLFEGQLSQEAAPSARPPDSLFQALSGMAARAAETPEDPSQQDFEPDNEILRLLLLADANPNNEGLRAALEASLLDQGGVAPGPPPAAKSAIKALVKETLTAERLSVLGGPDAQCSVCREDLEVGDEVQVMPCSSGHVFHPPCLAPWLAEHNSCPVCRFELETDDMRYERQKEREKVEAEDRKGAAAALSHNEFMYI